MSALPKRERVPDYHYASEQSKALLEVLETASAEAKAAFEDVVAQFFINTATWGLDLWERQVGIEPNPALPLEDRRSVVRSKLVACGSTTTEMIQALTTSWANGNSEVLEYPEESRIEIKFPGVRGTPSNIEAISRELRVALPAHLDWSYIFTLAAWWMVEEQGLTFEDLSHLTWHELTELTWYTPNTSR